MDKNATTAADIFGYLTSKFESLEERPLSDVDSLVLACMSYYRIPEDAADARSGRGMPVADLLRAEWMGQMTHGLWSPSGLSRLLCCVVASPRFRGMRVCNYVSETDDAAQKQFAACTLKLPSGDLYVSFRGTDNSLVGWKEDFNMAFETGVPSQLRAVEYLERVARGARGRIYIGGHSKGGNLAVYAAANCKKTVFSRIERVFSHDGPGFTAEALSSADYAERAGKLSKTVPESSLIGMMFEQQEAYSVVKSTQVGVMQHDPFSWVVDGTSFAMAEGISRGAGFVDESVNEWISKMSREEREGFVNALFSVLYAGGQDTLAGLKGNLSVTLPAMISQLAIMDEKQRGYLVQAVGGLAQAFLPDFEMPSFEFSGFEMAAPAAIETAQGEGDAQQDEVPESEGLLARLKAAMSQLAAQEYEDEPGAEGKGPEADPEGASA